MTGPRTKALLADFGLVKSLQSADGPTATGVVLGTLEYLAPEQGRGLPVDGRADLYSVGVMLYRMLSGQLPFEADSPTALIFQHVYEPPTQLSEICPDVPSPVAGIVMRLLSKQPGDRYATAGDVLRELRTGVGRDTSRQTVPRALDRDRPQTRLITAPVWSELPQSFWADDAEERSPTIAPSAPTALPGRESGDGSGRPPEQTGWKTRVRDRMATIFRRHAPEALKQLQSTQQQMDGAIGEYERRQKRLQKIEQEAVSVLAELKDQAAAERAAVADADRQSATASDRGEVEAAQDRRLMAERSAAELERQAVLQEEQLGTIRLQLAQVQATLQRLRTQRDILQARLKVAVARASVDRGGFTSKATRRRRLIVRIGLLMTVLAVGTALVVSFPRLAASPAGIRIASWLGLTAEPAAPAVTAFDPSEPLSKYWSKSADFSADGRTMVLYEEYPAGSTTDAGRLQVWDLRQGRQVGNLEPSAPWHARGLSPDGTRFLASTNRDRLSGLFLWDVASGKLLKQWAAPSVATGRIHFSPDGRLAYVTASGKISVVDLQALTLQRRDPPLEFDHIHSLAVDPVHGTVATAVGLSIDTSRRIAIDVYDNPQLTRLKTTWKPPAPIEHLRFSRDGEWLVGSMLGKLILYKTSDWSVVKELPVETGQAWFDISPDRQRVATLQKGKVNLWNVATGKKERSFDASDAAFAPNGVLVLQLQSRMQFVEAETGNERLLPGL